MEQSASHEQAKDLAELKKQHAVLEERMKTLQSDLQGTLERFRADMARRDTDMADLKTDLRTDMARRDTDMADLRTDMARRDTEAGKRENRLLISILGGIAVATAVLGVLITAQ